MKCANCLCFSSMIFQSCEKGKEVEDGKLKKKRENRQTTQTKIFLVLFLKFPRVSFMHRCFSLFLFVSLWLSLPLFLASRLAFFFRFHNSHSSNTETFSRSVALCNPNPAFYNIEGIVGRELKSLFIVRYHSSGKEKRKGKEKSWKKGSIMLGEERKPSPPVT